MKKELNRKIQELCDAAGTAAAEAMKPELIKNLNNQYDARIAAGMSELDAYRDVLRNVDRIEAMLNALPTTDEELELRDRAEGQKSLEFYIGKASAVMWIGTTILFFLLGFGAGLWAGSWLVFLWAAIGQILLGMAKKYNRIRKLNKVFRGGLSGILWVGTTILFFLLGFGAELWSISCLVFPMAAIVQILLSTFLPDEK